MRPLYFLFYGLLLLSASSCAGTRYKYYSFESAQHLRGSNGGFVYRGYDSVDIAYSWRNTREMRVEVLNQSQQPIFIDWERSQVISNGKKQPHSFHSAKLPTSEQTQGVAPDSTNIGKIAQQESEPDSVRKELEKQVRAEAAASDGAILPNRSKSYTLSMGDVTAFAPSLYRPVKYSETYYKPSNRVEVRQFDRQDSPFRVQVQLAYQKQQGEGKIVDQTFWLNEVIETEYARMETFIVGKQEPPLDERRFNKVVDSKSIDFSMENTAIALTFLATIIKVAAWASQL